MSAKDYVGAVELPGGEALHRALDPAEVASVRSAAEANRVTAEVSGGILLVFAEDVPPASRSDVGCSLLLAQLAADKQFNRRTDLLKWYAKFADTLSNIAWTVDAFAFKPVEGALPMDWSAYLSSALDGDARRLSKLGIDACEAQSAAGGAFKAWAASAIGSSRCQFMVGAVLNDGGSPQLSLVSVNFDNAALEWGFFVQAARIKALREVNRLELNETLYAEIRQAIIDKLGERVRSLIVPVPIPA